MSAFAGANTSVKDLEPVVPEIVLESTLDVQTVEAQTGIPQAIQRVESSPIPESGDITMGEAPMVTVSDPGSGLPAFLARFDLLEFNSLPASHFHRFGPPSVNFLHFYVPVEGLPLL